MDEALGEAAIKEIQKSTTGPMAAAVEGAGEALAKESQSKILTQLQRSAPGREIYKSTLGKDVREAVIANRDAVKAEADRLYGVVRTMPGGEGKVFAGENLQDDFKKILDSLPAPEQRVLEPTGLVDQFGKPYMAEGTKTRALLPFVPEKIEPRLREVIGLQEPQFSLSDLQQMRRDVYDDIAKAQGVPGLDTHYLNDMAKAITKSIDDGVAALPTGDLKKALAAANEHYKNKVVPFNRRGLTELFANVHEPVFVSDSSVVTRLVTGENAIHNWQLAKETLPPATFDRVRRTVLDGILENSRMLGDDTLDARAVWSGLKALKDSSREIYDDVVKGLNTKDLDETIAALGLQQTGKISKQQLNNLLASSSPTAFAARRLMQAQKQKDTLYKNSLFRAIGSGKEVTEETLKPVDFVNRLLDSASPTEVNQVLDAIKGQPALMEQLKQKTFEKVFRDSGRRATMDDLNRILSGDPSHILSGEKIAASLADRNYRTKLTSILGKDGMQDLEQYAKLQRGPEMKEASFSAAGGIQAGMQIARAEKTGLLSLVPETLRNWTYATLLTKPPLTSWLTRIPEEPGKWALLFSSPPFVEALAKEFKDNAPMAASLFKRSVDAYASKRGLMGSPTPANEPRVLPLDEARKRWELELDSMAPQTMNAVTNAPSR
jgi:hypothetical protein